MSRAIIAHCHSVLTALLVCAPVLGLTLLPQEGSAMLVFAPRLSGGALQAMAEADARLVRASERTSLAVVSSDAPDLGARLYRAGASLVISARFVSGCSRKTGPLS